MTDYTSLNGVFKRQYSAMYEQRRVELNTFIQGRETLSCFSVRAIELYQKYCEETLEPMSLKMFGTLVKSQYQSVEKRHTYYLGLKLERGDDGDWRSR